MPGRWSPPRRAARSCSASRGRPTRRCGCSPRAPRTLERVGEGLIRVRIRAPAGTPTHRRALRARRGRALPRLRRALRCGDPRQRRGAAPRHRGPLPGRRAAVPDRLRPAARLQPAPRRDVLPDPVADLDARVRRPGRGRPDELPPPRLAVAGRRRGGPADAAGGRRADAARGPAPLQHARRPPAAGAPRGARAVVAAAQRRRARRRPDGRPAALGRSTRIRRRDLHALPAVRRPRRTGATTSGAASRASPPPACSSSPTSTRWSARATRATRRPPMRAG